MVVHINFTDKVEGKIFFKLIGNGWRAKKEDNLLSFSKKISAHDNFN